MDLSASSSGVNGPQQLRMAFPRGHGGGAPAARRRAASWGRWVVRHARSWLRPGQRGKIDRLNPSPDHRGGTMSTEPFETDVPAGHRDRREHGGASARANDDELALRTERERVEAGLEPYDAADVPPATDVDPEVDLDIEGVAARQEAAGETAPLTKDNPFPPTRYAEE